MRFYKGSVLRLDNIPFIVKKGIRNLCYIVRDWNFRFLESGSGSQDLVIACFSKKKKEKKKD
jgi:hypothetical protein